MEVTYNKDCFSRFNLSVDHDELSYIKMALSAAIERSEVLKDERAIANYKKLLAESWDVSVPEE